MCQSKRRDKILAIDFDGTLYDGKTRDLVPGAAEAIPKLYHAGYVLILWTCRTGNRLKNAENILKRFDLLQYFTSVNQNWEHLRYKTSEKVCAGWYIDDRNIGGFPGWDAVLKELGV